MSRIILENMEFFAYHGCLEHEKQLGNTFFVTLSMDLDTEKAGKTDDLDDTLNYKLVYDLVKAQMEVPSKLIEHAAQRIVDKVFDSFPQIEQLDVKLVKLQPPLGGKVSSVSIQMNKKR